MRNVVHVLFTLKDTYVSLSIIKFALYDAVCHFNNGNRSTFDILKQVGISSLASTPQELASQMIGTASRKHPVTALMLQSELEKKWRGAARAKADESKIKDGTSYKYG